MKKLFLILTLLFSFLIKAQVEFKPGVKLGLNIANITHTNYDVRPDFYAGGLLSIKFSNFYTLQPELTYSRQGARQQLDGGSNPDIELDYLSLIVANKFKLFKNISLHAIVGPYIGYKTRDNIKGGTLSIFNDFDMGIFVGLSYELFSRFEFEARYKQGFMDVSDVNRDDNNHTHANKVIQIGLNYKFDLKK